MRANQASDALVQYESGQELVAMQQMDQHDRKLFSIDDTPWSDAPGREPKIRPDGMLTGGVIEPNTGTDDSVTVSLGTAYQSGVEEEVTGATLAIERSTGGLEMDATDDHAIASIVVDGTGAYAIVDGTAGTAFSETRDAAGGPPLIPQGQVEVGQIRLTSETSAEIAENEIYQVENTHKEMALVPMWTENFATGEVTFVTNLPEIHVAADGNKTKQVHAEVYEPIFANLEPASDFVPIETTHSQTSTEVYGGAIGARTSSLGQATFTVFLNNGVTDPIISLKNTRMWVKFYPHRLRNPYMLTLGTLGISRTFPAGDNMQAACTLTGESPTIEVSE